MSSDVAIIDNLRTKANASITNAYTAVGTPVTYPIRLVCFTNNCDQDMYFSNDGVNDKVYVAKGSFKLFDITTNRDNKSSQFCLTAGMQFYVKYAAAPTTGAVFIEVIYGNS